VSADATSTGERRSMADVGLLVDEARQEEGLSSVALTRVTNAT
jgi:hypothetical protein